MNRLNKLNNNASLNNELLQTFKNFDPDIVVLGHADKIHNKTLENFKSIKRDIKIVEWNVDNYYLDNTENKFKKRSHLIDAFLLQNADQSIKTCLSNNNSISFFPNIFDLINRKPSKYLKKFYDYDVFYALSYGVGSENKVSKSDYDREGFQNILKNHKSIKTNFWFRRYSTSLGC